MTNDPHGVKLMMALAACEQAQAGGALMESAVDSAALAHGVDAFALLERLIEKRYECDRARLALADTRTGAE